MKNGSGKQSLNDFRWLKRGYPKILKILYQNTKQM